MELKQGNPTRSSFVNKLISAVKKKVRKQREKYHTDC